MSKGLPVTKREVRMTKPVVNSDIIQAKKMALNIAYNQFVSNPSTQNFSLMQKASFEFQNCFTRR